MLDGEPLKFARSKVALHVCLVLCAVVLTAGAQSQAEHPSLPPAELVRWAVHNEIQASNDNAKYLFVDRKETPHGSQTKLMVQTRDAMAGMVVAENDIPLSSERQQGELARVRRFILEPEELVHKQRQEQENAERILRIVKALPDAFLYEYDGTETGKAGVGSPGHELVRLKFRPNPHYDPPSRVEQVLTGMQGVLLIDGQGGRIAQIDGTLAKEVSFGWGIFGHLDRGGHFLVEQGDVDNNHWEITRMGLKFSGKLLIFKNVNIQSTEVFSNFCAEPSNLTFAQGVELLEKEGPKFGSSSQQAGNGHSK
jgi:hypothetical protein